MPAETSAPTRASVGLRSERGPILGSVMLSIALIAIDSTILATAVPAIVRDLGGFTQFPWLFSAYLLAQAITTPVYGKLADVFGRKPMMLFGIGLFVLGSVLCAVAWSMGALIAFRALQGLGAGAIQPSGMTIMGDIYSVAERAVAQGYIASVWAMSAVVGPALGGLFSDHLSWRWIFWINLPLGLLAAAVLLVRFHEEREPRERRPIDVTGSVLVAGASALLLLALLEGGIRWPWWSFASVGLLVGSAVLVALFVLVESRAADPVLPGWLFRRRVLNAALVGSFVAGVVMMGVTSYVPVYAQQVLGSGATVAGFAVAALAIGWPIAASSSGRIYLRWGFRACLLLGGGFGALGAWLLVLVGPGSGVWLPAVACLVLGLGLGYVVSPSVVALQSAVGFQERGVATGANMFGRSVGSAVGVAAFGAIANAAVASRLDGGGHAGAVDLDELPVSVLDPALQAVFLAVACSALLLVAAGLLMPRRGPDPVE
ncbi:MDR family MFS transporter [Nocardioides sp. TF02-7]|uniref:MDR family MFS transporter n=1 Tax=Nocardioides sp. TF02-7 TaxID=2917724 RepID=UPI001F062AFC|nr:MDR family MFS transporter [Nocardioides sp. TF02-7]UMG94477.1 MFS transporter [Nocardioides sp. TF02-7]